MKIKRKINKILFIFGTRPEAIKMAPIIRELEKNKDKFVWNICVTAQHRQMLDQVLYLFGIKPDYDLNIMKLKQSLFDVTVCVLEGLKRVLIREKPDIVLVQGDTTTAMAGSLAAFYYQIPIAHIEAGLRTYNKFAPFPEEVNRRITSVMADLHFAPTKIARDNLKFEGIASEKIHVTGNTVIDALFFTIKKINQSKLKIKIAEKFINNYPKLKNILLHKMNTVSSKKIILVTGHRRENFGKGFENICNALKAIADSNEDVEIIYPVHLNPHVQKPVRHILNGCKNIHLIQPLDYLPFVYIMNQSYLIMTDSGGVQEEAPSLGKPVILMRDNTERPEGIKAGKVLLVGTEPNEIINKTNRLLIDQTFYENMSKKENPYGDGKASLRIVSELYNFLK